MKRSAFLQFSASALAMSVIGLHQSLQAGVAPAALVNKVRIKSLELVTVCPLEKLQDFYANVIGLGVMRDNENRLSVICGETPITFIKIDDPLLKPFYHFAFNIPENKIEKAFAWQRPKTPLVKPGVDSIVNFAHWNAHSIFFLDPAGNLVEYIARHDLANAAPGDFSVRDILYVSEIGLIVKDVIRSGSILQNEIKLNAYRPSSPGFWPIGDENGLLLLIETGKEWAKHPARGDKTAIFQTRIVLEGDRSSQWMLPGYPYAIISG